MLWRYLRIGMLSWLLTATFGINFASAFTLQPAIIELAANQGENKSSILTITNDEDTERTFYLTIQKFVANGDRGQQTFLPPDDTFGLPDWIFFDRPSFRLKAHEKQAIPFIVKVPKNATPGEYHVALFFSNQLPTQNSQGSVSFGAKTGALLFFTVNGNLKTQIDITGFDTVPPGIRKAHFLPSFQVELKNSGNVSVIPRGNVYVTNNKIMRLTLNETGGRILPDSSRLFDITWGWEKIFSDKNASFFERAKNELKYLAFGNYTARLVVDGIAQGHEIHFSVWPVELLVLAGGGVLIILALAVVCIWLVRRGRTKGK